MTDPDTHAAAQLLLSDHDLLTPHAADTPAAAQLKRLAARHAAGSVIQRALIRSLRDILLGAGSPPEEAGACPYHAEGALCPHGVNVGGARSCDGLYEDAKVGGTRRCEVVRGLNDRHRFVRRALTADLHPRYYDLTWETMLDANHAKWLMLKGYAEEYRSRWLPSCGSLFLQGPYGYGKTQGAALVSSTVIRQGGTALLTSVDRCVAAMTSREHAIEHLRRQFVDTELVVLNDVGHYSKVDWQLQEFNAMLHARLEAGRPVLITTNFDPKALAGSTFSDPVMDRLSRSSQTLMFDFRNYRAELGDETRQEMKGALRKYAEGGERGGGLN